MNKTKNCPYCGEEIMADARKCKHCGEWLEEDPIQEQTQEAEKKETDDSVNPNAEPKQTEPVMPTKAPSLDKKSSTHKSKKWLFAVIPIVVVIAGVGLYLFGVFGNEPIIKGLSSKSENSEVGLKQPEEEIKAEIERQVIEAYNNGSAYNLMTSDFEEKAFNAAYALRDFHVTNSYAEVLDLLFGRDGISIEKVNVVGKDKAEVYVSAGDESPVFIMVHAKTEEKSGWLIDDVCSYYGISSMKRELEEYSDNLDWDNAFENYEEELAEFDKEDEKWSPKDETEAEIQRQILEDYNTCSIEGIMTPEFKKVQDDMMAAMDIGFIPEQFSVEEFYYGLQCGDATIVNMEYLDDGKVYVVLDLVDEYDVDVVVEWSNDYVMVNRDSLWLIDDVGLGEGSSKKRMMEFINNSNNTMVVIDGSELRLRLEPSTSSETLKWGDGSNRHPDVGERFKCLGESVDFYKIDYKGHEAWVSKQYTHAEIQK